MKKIIIGFIVLSFAFIGASSAKATTSQEIIIQRDGVIHQLITLLTVKVQELQLALLQAAAPVVVEVHPIMAVSDGSMPHFATTSIDTPCAVASASNATGICVSEQMAITTKQVTGGVATLYVSGPVIPSTVQTFPSFGTTTPSMSCTEASAKNLQGVCTP